MSDDYLTDYLADRCAQYAETFGQISYWACRSSDPAEERLTTIAALIEQFDKASVDNQGTAGLNVPLIERSQGGAS